MPLLAADPLTPRQIALVVILFLGIPALWVFWFYWLGRVSTAIAVRGRPYRLALEALHSHAEVRSALGAPIEASALSSCLTFGPLGGRASYDILVVGSNGSGNLYVEARRFWRPWRFTTLRLGLHGGGEIDLRPPEDGLE